MTLPNTRDGVEVATFHVQQPWEFGGGKLGGSKVEHDREENSTLTWSHSHGHRTSTFEASEPLAHTSSTETRDAQRYSQTRVQSILKTAGLGRGWGGGGGANTFIRALPANG